MSRLLLLFTAAALVWAQDSPAPQPPKPKPMPEPKNLQVLKPGPDLIPTMRSWNAALGVQCAFCHVKGDFASDENRHKGIARRMITLTQDINAKLVRSPDAKNVVSCYTCHRGEEHPQVNAPEHAEPRPPAAAPAP